MFRSTRVILVVAILDRYGSLVAEGISTPDPKSHVRMSPIILSGSLRQKGDYYILVRADNREPEALVGVVTGPEPYTKAIKSSPVGPYSLRLDLPAMGD